MHLRKKILYNNFKKTKMKKVLFVFAVAGLVSLASCGGTKEEVKVETTDSTTVTTTVDTTQAVVADTTKKVEEVKK